MPIERASLTAILGPTNTGKTHLAVERMCAHVSGMMGFPLRLLAREIYDRLVKIKGIGLVALITGEEKIEPPGARYFCCTVESMPMEREFAFVAVDEAQLAADPERGHIFTDRILHARGYSETMILGSESLRPLIRSLLPKAEIITRPRFSTLSYAGAKKLSRLPKRSAIVGFSVEQVYAVAETLRRLRGGCAVVMGALSPRTRNAQVDMFQSGEVDYLVATDAIGMGLNLDVAHVAFAGLGKFDGARRRRLTVAEMAQIAGRAGRHQKDGTFGTLAGEAGEMTPEEILAIEDHKFPPLDWMYWREAEPRFDSIDALIADLEMKPDRAGLRAAPEAIDLDVLKRLSEIPGAATLARKPKLVERMWEAARLPDFRQLGPEPHARFVASLWQHLGTGLGHLPYAYVASEIARLDNIQGDVATLSQRIAAVRTWTYIAHRGDWLADPHAMAERTKALEEKLSDALHAALRQRFVDRRTSTLMRSAGMDTALLPVEIDDDKRVLVDGQDIGTLDGFAFRVDAGANVGERKLFLAAAQRHLAGLLRQKARDVRMAQDLDFSLSADAERKPAIYYKQDLLGYLTKGRDLLHPVFKPSQAVGELESDALRDIITRAEAWIADQMERHMAGIIGLQTLAQDPAVDGSVRAFAAQLADQGGIASRVYMHDAIQAMPKDERGAVRKAGVVFGALDIFHRSASRPATSKWRSAMFAARDNSPMQDMPPESAVHLKEWNFANAADCRNAGYRRVGSEYLRFDLADRVIKKAHEMRGSALVFSMDLGFATSLGVSMEGLTQLMRDGGFKPAQDSEISVPVQLPEETLDQADGETPAETQTGAAAEESVVSEQSVVNEQGEQIIANKGINVPVFSTWRWFGLRAPKPKNNTRFAVQPKGDGGAENKPSFKSKKQQGKSRSGNTKEQSPPKTAPPASPPSALALQLMALQEKQSTKIER
jgi:ATP-dependent RNA helicase SUPV3L1/SUV3